MNGKGVLPQPFGHFPRRMQLRPERKKIESLDSRNLGSAVKAKKKGNCIVALFRAELSRQTPYQALWPINWLRVQ